MAARELAEGLDFGVCMRREISYNSAAQHMCFLFEHIIMSPKRITCMVMFFVGIVTCNPVTGKPSRSERKCRVVK